MSNNIRRPKPIYLILAGQPNNNNTNNKKKKNNKFNPILKDPNI